jgi:hypothetical protein
MDRTVESAIFDISAVVTVAVAEPERASHSTVSSGGCRFHERPP